VINVDDPLGLELAERAPPDAGLVVTGRRTDPAQRMPGARFLRALHSAHRPEGLEIALEGSWGPALLRSRLIGDFNVDNLLTVLGVLLSNGMAFEQARGLLERCEAPPGRMQLVGGGNLPVAIVDYAHTPDALDNALRAARAHCAGRLLCVFGCGGERDRGKRPQMGQVAEALADALYITDDNPRGEDPEQIVTEIMAGLKHPERAKVQHDRAAAIAAALGAAAAGDVVLIAGKGHEDYQLAGQERRAFSDVVQVRAALRVRSAA
jgi:UDP-N-acetylmuramoyl-L-alanyl-D-glutamate--2,6-diaminopimelate ligase